MFFAVLMIAAAIGATIPLGVYAGGIWGAGAFALLLVTLYRAFTDENGPDGSIQPGALNSFQQPLSDD